MIPSLPPELICQIIESAVPSSFHCRPYKERRQTLRKLCLVSQLFRDIAQPLFREIVSVRSGGSIGYLTKVASDNGWTDQVHQAVISTPMQAELPRSLESFGLIFPQITVLALTHRHTLAFDMSLLCRFYNLQILQLEGPRFWLPKDIKLPKLLSLTFIGDRTEHAILDLLSPSALPSLQILALPHIHESRLLHATRCPAFLKLLTQVHALFLPGSALFTTTFEAVKPFLHKTLVDLYTQYDYSQRLFRRVEHARVLGRQVHHPNGLGKLLNEQAKIPLRSVYLDHEFEADSYEYIHEPFISTCQKYSIQVIYETVSLIWNSEPGISEEFLRRQRERRRLEANKTTV